MSTPTENYGPPEMQEWARDLISKKTGEFVYTADCVVVNDAEKRFPGRASLAMAVLMIEEWKASSVTRSAAELAEGFDRESRSTEPEVK